MKSARQMTTIVVLISTSAAFAEDRRVGTSISIERLDEHNFGLLHWDECTLKDRSGATAGERISMKSVIIAHHLYGGVPVVVFTPNPAKARARSSPKLEHIVASQWLITSFHPLERNTIMWVFAQDMRQIPIVKDGLAALKEAKRRLPTPPNRLRSFHVSTGKMEYDCSLLRIVDMEILDDHHIYLSLWTPMAKEDGEGQEWAPDLICLLDNEKPATISNNKDNPRLTIGTHAKHCFDLGHRDLTVIFASGRDVEVLE